MSDFVLIVVPAVLLGLSIVAVFKDLAAKVLFWIYLYIVLSLIGHSLSCAINHDVFYLIRDDFEKIIASLIVLVIPVILQLKIEYKRLIRGLLYAIQFFICIILSLWIYISTDCDEPRPLSRTDIEKMVLLKIPDYRIIEFDVFYNIDQTLKFKGDRTRFYESLDSISKVDGSGWVKNAGLYVFDSLWLDDEHKGKTISPYCFYSMYVYDNYEAKIYVDRIGSYCPTGLVLE